MLEGMMSVRYDQNVSFRLFDTYLILLPHSLPVLSFLLLGIGELHPFRLEQYCRLIETNNWLLFFLKLHMHERCIPVTHTQSPLTQTRRGNNNNEEYTASASLSNGGKFHLTLSEG